MPPPMQSVARLFLALRRAISWSSVPGGSDQGDARRWSGVADVLVGVDFELLEIVAEHLDQTARRFGEFALAAPSLDRIEDVRLDAGHLVRHGEAEMRIGAEGGLVQRAVERGREQAARHADRHAPADADPAARPAGVDQPAVDVMPGDQVAQQIADCWLVNTG